MTVKVKICGLTRLEDAMAAADCGADFLGFIHYARSPRYVDPVESGRIAAAVKQTHPTIRTVAVFVNKELDAIANLMDRNGYDYAQLSGDEGPEDLIRLDRPAFKAIRPRNEVDAQALARQYARAPARPALLLDAAVAGAYGGTGVRTDLALAAGLARVWDLMLAGGLDPENVAEAVRVVRPWAVDVASGVEASPGVKDHAKIRMFIENAKSFTTESTELTEILKEIPLIKSK